MYANQTQVSPPSDRLGASAVRERQLPDQFNALDKAISELDELFCILEQRLAPLCLEAALGKAENERPYPNLCPAASQVFNSRLHVEAIIGRLHNLLSSLEV